MISDHMKRTAIIISVPFAASPIVLPVHCPLIIIIIIFGEWRMIDKWSKS